jgi:hypothetical protein
VTAATSVQLSKFYFNSAIPEIKLSLLVCEERINVVSNFIMIMMRPSGKINIHDEIGRTRKKFVCENIEIN